jgi:hypothetical protein
MVVHQIGASIPFIAKRPANPPTLKAKKMA